MAADDAGSSSPERSQIRTVLSPPPLASQRPSGLKARLITGPSWVPSVREPPGPPQTFTVWSVPPLAIVSFRAEGDVERCPS